MPLWRLRPTHAPGAVESLDPHPWAEVIVRAPTAAEARALAAAMDAESTEHGASGPGRLNDMHSMLLDDKHYRLDEIDAESGYAAGGPAEVVEARRA